MNSLFLRVMSCLLVALAAVESCCAQGSFADDFSSPRPSLPPPQYSPAVRTGQLADPRLSQPAPVTAGQLPTSFPAYNPAALNEPLDPLTGLPLRMTSLAWKTQQPQTQAAAPASGAPNLYQQVPARNTYAGVPHLPVHGPQGVEYLPAPPQNALQQAMPQPELIPHAPASNIAPPGSMPQTGSSNGSPLNVSAPGLNPWLNQVPSATAPQPASQMPVLPSPQPAAFVIQQSLEPGPVRLDPRLESMDGEPLVTMPPFFTDGTAIADNSPNFPIPQLDPPLLDAGNKDGKLDWIDLIDEYAGRATRSDMPGDPAGTAHEDRSWLRIDHWNVDALWLAGRGNQFGMATSTAAMTIGLPKIKGITVQPVGAFHVLSGPYRTDMPAQLFDGAAEVAWMHRFSDRVRMRISGKGGLYSDLQTSENLRDAVRFSGMGISTFELTPDLQMVLGAAWINLENRRMLPVAGFIWSPNDDLRLDLVCPEGRIAARVKDLSEKSRWAYFSGAFYGRTWQVERQSGTLDLVTYSDIRFAVGIEDRHISGITSFVELGTSVSRNLEYQSGLGSYNPVPVGFVRGGLSF